MDISEEFIEYLRPATIIYFGGRLRRVPFIVQLADWRIFPRKTKKAFRKQAEGRRLTVGELRRVARAGGGSGWWGSGPR